MKKDIKDKIVEFTHGGNHEVMETTDFLQGVKFAIKYMAKHQTIKSFLKNCIELANQPIGGLKGEGKLTVEQLMKVSELSVILQNDLSEIREILEIFNLEYKG